MKLIRVSKSRPMPLIFLLCLNVNTILKLLVTMSMLLNALKKFGNGKSNFFFKIKFLFTPSCCSAKILDPSSKCKQSVSWCRIIINSKHKHIFWKKRKKLAPPKCFFHWTKNQRQIWILTVELPFQTKKEELALNVDQSRRPETWRLHFQSYTQDL